MSRAGVRARTGARPDRRDLEAYVSPTHCKLPFLGQAFMQSTSISSRRAAVLVGATSAREAATAVPSVSSAKRFDVWLQLPDLNWVAAAETVPLAIDQNRNRPSGSPPAPVAPPPWTDAPIFHSEEPSRSSGRGWLRGRRLQTDHFRGRRVGAVLALLGVAAVALLLLVSLFQGSQRNGGPAADSTDRRGEIVGDTHRDAKNPSETISNDSADPARGAAARVAERIVRPGGMI